MAHSVEPTALIQAARSLAKKTRAFGSSPPSLYTYHPMDYAWEAHSQYLEKYGKGTKKAVFLGMNPGPFGMAQTGVPFGEINAVRSWLDIEASIVSPPQTHPKKPVDGFQCSRSEVSGRRLWGAFKERFRTPKRFFKDHFVLHYCPLLFTGETGKNLTPDQLPTHQTRSLYEACDDHLLKVIRVLKPRYLIGVGTFAEKKAIQVLKSPQAKGICPPEILRILPPSPASPAANRDWAGQVTQTLEDAGVW